MVVFITMLQSPPPFGKMIIWMILVLLLCTNSCSNVVMADTNNDHNNNTSSSTSWYTEHDMNIRIFNTTRDVEIWTTSIHDDNNNISSKSSSHGIIKMIQFYHPNSSTCEAFVSTYQLLGQLVHDIFPLGVIDISTGHGQSIVSYLLQSKISYHDMIQLVVQQPQIYIISIPNHHMIHYNTYVTNNNKHNDHDSIFNIETLTSTLLEQQHQVLSYRAQQLHITPSSSSTNPTKNQNTKHTKPSTTNDQNSNKPNHQQQQTQTSSIIQLTDDNYHSIVYNTTAIVIVAFIAPWCGHCKKLIPEYEIASYELHHEHVIFGIVDATIHTMIASKYHINGYPTIKIYPGTKQGILKSSSMAIPYDGERTSTAIIQAILSEIDRTGTSKPIVQITSNDIFYKHCSKQLCMISILPHISESGMILRNQYINMITTISKSFRHIRTISFVWIEGGNNIQYEFEDAFDVTFGTPSIVAYSMEKQVYSTMKKSYTEKSITSFIYSIINGRQTTIPLRSGNTPNIVTVLPWDGKEYDIPIEEELSLEDIMGDDEL